MRAIRSAAALYLVSVLVVSCSEQPTPTEGPALGGPQFAARGSIVHRASLGSADACEAYGEPTGCNADFSLTAIEYADGTVTGQWSDPTGRDGHEPGHVAVDCLIVTGNQAVIGGVVTQSADPVWIGRRAITKVVDNGTSARDPPDQIGYTILILPGSPKQDCEDWADSWFRLFQLNNGQVVVR